MKPKYFCTAFVESDLALIGYTVFLRLLPSTMVIECKLPCMSAIFHVHEVHMNNLVRVLCWHERAAMWRLLGLGNVAGVALYVIW